MPSKAYQQCRAKVDGLEAQIARLEGRIRLTKRDKGDLQHRLTERHWVEERDRRPSGEIKTKHLYRMERLKGQIKTREALIQDLEAQKDRLRQQLRTALERCRSLASASQDNTGQKNTRKVDEAAARKKIADPAYWRDHDPALHQEVQAEFKTLYPR